MTCKLYVNIHPLVDLELGYFTIPNFVKSRSGHLEVIGLKIYSDLPSIDTFHYINNTTNLI